MPRERAKQLAYEREHADTVGDNMIGRDHQIAAGIVFNYGGAQERRDGEIERLRNFPLHYALPVRGTGAAHERERNRFSGSVLKERRMPVVEIDGRIEQRMSLLQLGERGLPSGVRDDSAECNRDCKVEAVDNVDGKEESFVTAERAKRCRHARRR